MYTDSIMTHDSIFMDDVNMLSGQSLCLVKICYILYNVVVMKEKKSSKIFILLLGYENFNDKV